MCFCLYINESLDFTRLLNQRIRVVKVKRRAFFRFVKYLQVFAVSYLFPAFSPIFLDLWRNSALPFWHIKGLSLWLLPQTCHLTLHSQDSHLLKNRFPGSFLNLGRERAGGCRPVVGGMIWFFLCAVLILLKQMSHLSSHLPYPKPSISCQSLDRNPLPPIFIEDFYFPVSAEWKQTIETSEVATQWIFSGSSVHMGIFKEPLIV